jgi:hypothetical protein
MSYDIVHIESDVENLKKSAYSKTKIISILAEKYKTIYPSISLAKAKRLIEKIYEGKQTRKEDW